MFEVNLIADYVRIKILNLTYFFQEQGKVYSANSLIQNMTIGKNFMAVL